MKRDTTLATPLDADQTTVRGGCLLSVRQKNSARQVVLLTAVAIATGYVREDPFRIGGIRQKSGFYFILGVSLRQQKKNILRKLLPT
ncbi:hypothetical protein AVEN_261295-1 [Araneus ventricosus]|uniref:Uncharacterized protein n=1 Tax=Araneus ventricosus TaxID=182803 RepID=A0A4Y2UNH9_ARAVE|nr:hypothetical protein AVEN_261295-1 [Araneus ventricosus]